MTSLQTWLSKPRATVRIDSSARWGAWIKALRRPFTGSGNRQHDRMQVLDRLSLGGKKALLLVVIDGRRFLVGLGDEAAPSVSALHGLPATNPAQPRARAAHVLSRRKRLRSW